MIVLYFLATLIGLGMIAEGMPPPPRDEFYSPVVTVSIVTLPLVVFAVVQWLMFVRAYRYMRTRGDGNAYVLAHRAAAFLRPLAALVYLTTSWATSWPQQLQLYTGPLATLVVLLPILIYYILFWVFAHPAEKHIAESGLYGYLARGEPVHGFPTRLVYAWEQFCASLLLVALPALLIGTSQQVYKHYVMFETFPYSLLPWVTLILLMLSAPAIVMRLWRTVPLDDPQANAFLASLRSKYNIKLRGPYIWPTHGILVNAAVIGLVYPFRYVIFSDGLLARMSDLRAVLAHEVGHVRFHHLPWLIAVMLASVFSTGWAIAIGAYQLQIDSKGDEVTYVATAAALSIAGLVFVWVSRRFEWQADAFAASELSTQQETISLEAVQQVQSVLLDVAKVGGIPLHRKFFTHGSMKQRCDLLASIVGQAKTTLSIDRTVRNTKRVTILLLLVNAALFAFEYWQTG